MNISLVIMTPEGRFFSGVKKNTPKLANAMKEIAEGYSKTYGGEFKVKRIIPAKNGWKVI